jgi:hypothetical protein
MAVSIGGSFYQRILADIRYATMDEKEASKDILVQRENPFNKFDISEYDEVVTITFNVFIPCYEDMEEAMEGINSPDIKNANSTDVLNAFLSSLEKWQVIFYQQSENQKGMLKEMLKQQYLQFAEMTSSIYIALNSHSDPEIQIAERNFLISNIKTFHLNYCYMLLSLGSGVIENIGISAIYDRLVENVQEFDNDPLIDLETPYFSLPVQYAEEKEKQILTYIENGKNDVRSIMALIILYIKMKSITDAEMLYYTMIAPMRFLNKQDDELSKTIELMLEEIKNNNPYAYLDKTTINIDGNMNVYITEHYFIDRPENDKDIYVFLPYNKDAIVLHSSTDRNNEQLELKALITSWKDSCYLQFSCNEDLFEFSLKYRVKSFFEYSDNFGTYSYKYGGINSNAHYTCNIIMSGNLKSTIFRMPPAEMKDDDGEQEIIWHNPKIPFKINALGFEGQKNGIAGEIVNKWMLYNRLLYSIFILLIFLVIWRVISYVITNEMVYELMFVFISLAMLLFLYKDIFFVQKISSITQYLSPNVLRYMHMLMVLISYVLLWKVKFKKESKRQFNVFSSVLLLSILINEISIIIQNTDMTSTMAKISAVSLCGGYLYFLLTNLSEQLNVPKMVVGMIVLGIAIASLFMSNIAKTIYISKEKLDIIGLVFSILFGIIMGFCYIVEHNEAKSAKDIKKVKEVIDVLTFALQGKTDPFVHVLLITMIAFGLFSKLSMFVEILGIVASIFGPMILEKLMNGNLFKKADDNS